MFVGWNFRPYRAYMADIVTALYNNYSRTLNGKLIIKDALVICTTPCIGSCYMPQWFCHDFGIFFVLWDIHWFLKPLYHITAERWSAPSQFLPVRMSDLRYWCSRNDRRMSCLPTISLQSNCRLNRSVCANASMLGSCNRGFACFMGYILVKYSTKDYWQIRKFIYIELLGIDLKENFC